MKIRFTGTGSAFTLKNYQVSALIETEQGNLLIDAGGDCRRALDALGLSYKDIEAVYVTHSHEDHIGGLEYLAFSSFFTQDMEKIKLYGNSQLLFDLWHHSLCGGLRSVQTRQMELTDYFDVKKVPLNGQFTWRGITFEIVQSVHIMNKYAIVPSYGLMITEGDKKVYYTGDTQFNPNQIMDFYNQADIIIQDCEVLPFKTGVHASYDELCTLPDEVKAKMFFVHFQDTVITDAAVWQSSSRKDGFKGFLMPGERLTI